jgi:Protein of unknown function (DUF1648)
MRIAREVLAGLGVLVACVSLAFSWRSLPATVPVHFDLTGVADGYGSKQTLLTLPAVAVALYLMLTIVVRFTDAFNFPVAVTGSNRQGLETLAIDMVGWLKVETTWIFAWLTLAAVSAAAGKSRGLGLAFAPLSIGAIAVTIILFTYRMNRAR